MARKKAMDYQTRALRLHLGAPKLTRGRQNVDIQTDADLEEVREQNAFIAYSSRSHKFPPSRKSIVLYTHSRKLGDDILTVTVLVVFLL